jgi:hypothetical protein
MRRLPTSNYLHLASFPSPPIHTARWAAARFALPFLALATMSCGQAAESDDPVQVGLANRPEKEAPLPKAEPIADDLTEVTMRDPSLTTIVKLEKGGYRADLNRTYQHAQIAVRDKSKVISRTCSSNIRAAGELQMLTSHAHKGDEQ